MVPDRTAGSTVNVCNQGWRLRRRHQRRDVPELTWLIDDARPVSRHLTGLAISLETTGAFHIGASLSDGDELDIYPCPARHRCHWLDRPGRPRTHHRHTGYRTWLIRTRSSTPSSPTWGSKAGQRGCPGHSVENHPVGRGDANGLDPTPNASQISLINEWRRAPLNQLKVDDKDSSIIVAEQVIPAEVGAAGFARLRSTMPTATWSLWPTARRRTNRCSTKAQVAPRWCA